MKTYLTYGIGITFASAVLTLILHIMGFWTDPEKLGTAFMITLPLALIIIIGGIVMGTKAVRNQQESERFSYGQAWRAGVMIAVFTAVSGGIFNFVYYKYINPSWNETGAAWTKTFMEKMGAPEAQIEKKVEEARSKTVSGQVINGLIFTVILGAVSSLITAAILKREPKEDLSKIPPPAAA